MAERDGTPYDRQPAHDEMRAQLAATREAFHSLLDKLSDDDLQQPSLNPKWTNGALLSHIIVSLRFLPLAVASAKRGRGMFNLPAPVFDPVNATIASVLGKHQSIASLRHRYDSAFDAALTRLDGVQPEELQRGANFYRSGFHDIRRLYESQAHHLAEHGADVVFNAQSETPSSRTRPSEGNPSHGPWQCLRR
ncbi:MAG: DinB family protein [Thermomicrobiales bacterium]|nr:DinB family protein [Thermomicrobiales bacterium]